MLKQLVVLVVIAIVILSSSWALLHPGFFRIHDFVHGARIAEMARAIQDGHIPVRWSQNFGFGYGMPLFEFYAPLPYAVGAIIFILGFPLVTSVKLLFLLCTILTTVGAYKLGKELYGKVGGLLTAAAITLAPYRAVNLYVRGAVSEAWAIMAIVWILFFTVLLFKEKRFAWYGLVISVVGLCLSHNLTTLIFFPAGLLLTVAYGLFATTDTVSQVFSVKQLLRVLKTSVKIILGYLVAIGISAFYLVPAFLEKNYTKIEQYIIGGYFDYHLHFVYLRQFITPYWGYGGSGWGPDDGISFFLGWGQWIGLLLFAVVVVSQIGRLLIRRATMLSSTKFWLLVWISGVAGLGLLLATEKSLIVWESIEILKFIQFPWRTLSIVIVCIGLLVPSFLLLIPSFIKRWFAAWLVLLILLANAWIFKPEEWLDSADSQYYSSPERIQKDMSSILPDYIPVDLQEDLEPATSLLTCNNCEAEVLVERTHQKLVQVTAAQATSLLFSVAYYPGWQLEINGKPAEYKVTEEGLIEVEVPAGESRIGLWLAGTPLRNAADIISLISIVLFLGVYIYTMTPALGKQRRQ